MPSEFTAQLGSLIQEISVAEDKKEELCNQLKDLCIKNGLNKPHQKFKHKDREIRITDSNHVIKLPTENQEEYLKDILTTTICFLHDCTDISAEEIRTFIQETIVKHELE